MPEPKNNQKAGKPDEGPQTTAAKEQGPPHCPKTRVGSETASWSSEANFWNTGWVSVLQLILLCFAGWLNRNQQLIIEYLQEEVRVLREQPGKKPASTTTSVAGWQPNPRSLDRIG